MGRLGSDMFLSNPPATEACIYLRYRHTGDSFAVTIQYTSRHESTLTLDQVFKEAESAQGVVWLEEWDASSPYPTIRPVDEDVTLDMVTSTYIGLHGGSFLLDLQESWMQLDAIVPTEEEWETIRQVLVDEEEKKKLMDPDQHAA
jgi:hypothetical protein